MSFIVLSFLSIPGISQKSLSLNEAIRYGLQNNLGLQIADERVRSTALDTKLAKAMTLPSIGFKLRQGNIFEIDNSPTSFVEGNYTQSSAKASVNLDWVLFDGYKAKLEARRLEQLEFRSAGSAQLVVENTTQAIILAYYKAILEQEKLKVLAEVTALSKERYKQGELLLADGSKSLFDVLSLEKAWIQDSIQYLKRSLSVELSMDDLKYLIGIRDVEKITLSSIIETPKNTYNLNSLNENLVSGNQDMKMQYMNIALQELSRKKMGAERYPTIRVNSNLGQDISTSKFRGDEPIKGSAFDFYTGFTVDYRLFDGGRTKALIKKAKVEEQIALLELAELENRLKDELGDAFNRYQYHSDIIAKTEELLLNLKKSLDIAKDRLEGGYSTPLEYRNTQLDYLNSNIDMLESLYELKSAETTMIRLTGGITTSNF